MTEPVPGNSNQFIELQLKKRLIKIEEHFGADVLSFSGPLIYGVDDQIRKVIESRENHCNEKYLVVILTSLGGYIEVVHRIVDIMRHHYKDVDFVIPNYAYSAGTVLAMYGDAIYMDYYSRLGPIDPQIPINEKMLPALGYLERYNRLIEKAEKGKITAAEIQLLIFGFDQAELYKYEQERELSITLLTEWLVKYKFKNWNRTETRGKPVTPTMRKNRAKQIARELNNTDRWHIHGYGISMHILQNDPKLKLIIDDFGENQELSKKIRCYYDLLNDYMFRRRRDGVLQMGDQYISFA